MSSCHGHGFVLDCGDFRKNRTRRRLSSLVGVERREGSANPGVGNAVSAYDFWSELNLLEAST